MQRPAHDQKIVIGMVAVLVLGGWIVWHYTPRNRNQRKALAGALSLARKAQDYGQDPAYYDELATAAHGRVYPFIYDWRGRKRRGGRYRSYVEHLLKNMIKQAKQDGRTDVADDLKEFLNSMVFPRGRA